MANIRDLKKDINFVLGDIIEAVFLWESATKNTNSKEGSAIIDNAIKIFDELIEKVNQKNVENKKQHFNGIRTELEKEATTLIEKLNGLTA